MTTASGVAPRGPEANFSASASRDPRLDPPRPPPTDGRPALDADEDEGGGEEGEGEEEEEEERFGCQEDARLSCSGEFSHTHINIYLSLLASRRRELEGRNVLRVSEIASAVRGLSIPSLDAPSLARSALPNETAACLNFNDRESYDSFRQLARTVTFNEIYVHLQPRSFRARQSCPRWRGETRNNAL